MFGERDNIAFILVLKYTARRILFPFLWLSRPDVHCRGREFNTANMREEAALKLCTVDSFYITWNKRDNSFILFTMCYVTTSSRRINMWNTLVAAHCWTKSVLLYSELAIYQVHSIGSYLYVGRSVLKFYFEWYRENLLKSVHVTLQVIAGCSVLYTLNYFTLYGIWTYHNLFTLNFMD